MSDSQAIACFLSNIRLSITREDLLFIYTTQNLLGGER